MDDLSPSLSFSGVQIKVNKWFLKRNFSFSGWKSVKFKVEVVGKCGFEVNELGEDVTREQYLEVVQRRNKGLLKVDFHVTV